MGKLQQDAGILNDSDVVRAVIADCERMLASISPANAATLMEQATDAHLALDRLAHAGSDVRPEQVRLDTIDERLIRNAQRIVTALGGSGAFAALRQRLAAGEYSGARWWRLDDILAAQRQALLRRMALTGAVILMLGIAAYLFRGVLFPPDPVGDAVTAAGRALSQHDTQTALRDIDAGLTHVPTSTQLLIWRAELLEAQGDPAAASVYTQVRTLFGNTTFLLERAQVDLALGNNDRPIIDMTALIASEPSAPEPFFLRATAYENKGQFESAITDLNQAADLAQRQGNDTLYATARVRLGTLMQAAGQQRSTSTP